jgi:hypothetical protein
VTANHRGKPAKAGRRDEVVKLAFIPLAAMTSYQARVISSFNDAGKGFTLYDT